MCVLKSFAFPVKDDKGSSSRLLVNVYVLETNKLLLCFPLDAVEVIAIQTRPWLRSVLGKGSPRSPAGR